MYILYVYNCLYKIIDTSPPIFRIKPNPGFIRGFPEFRSPVQIHRVSDNEKHGHGSSYPFVDDLRYLLFPSHSIAILKKGEVVWAYQWITIPKCDLN